MPVCCRGFGTGRRPADETHLCGDRGVPGGSHPYGLGPGTIPRATIRHGTDASTGRSTNPIGGVPGPSFTAPVVEDYHGQTSAGRHIAEDLAFWDETLRDGEQTPGVHFSPEEKLRVAELLSSMGVSVIDAGIPVVSVEEARAVRDVAHAGLKAKVLASARTVVRDVEAVIKSDVSHIAILVAASNVHLQYKLQMSQDEVVRATAQCLNLAH